MSESSCGPRACTCLASAGLALMTFGCFTSGFAQDAVGLTALREREGKLAPQHMVKSADGRFTAWVPAKVATPKIVAVAGSYSIAFDVGAPSTIDCEVDPASEPELATLLQVASEVAFMSLGRTRGDVEQRNLEAVDAGIVGKSPFLSASWRVDMRSDNDTTTGGVRLMVGRAPGADVSCMHTELGYANTFRAVSGALLESFELSSPGVIPHFVEIHTIRLAGKPAGIRYTEMIRDARGDSHAVTVTSLLSPPNDAYGRLAAQDLVRVEQVRSDGSLVEASYSETQDGDQSTELTLKHGEGDSWEVVGSSHGLNIRGTLPPGPPPESETQRVRRLQQHLTQQSIAGTALSSLRWRADIDPTHLARVTTTIVGPAGRDSVSLRENAGAGDVIYIVEKSTGQATAAVMPSDWGKLEFKRVHATGAP